MACSLDVVFSLGKSANPHDWVPNSTVSCFIHPFQDKCVFFYKWELEEGKETHQESHLSSKVRVLFPESKQKIITDDVSIPSSVSLHAYFIVSPLSHVISPHDSILTPHVSEYCTNAIIPFWNQWSDKWIIINMSINT